MSISYLFMSFFYLSRIEHQVNAVCNTGKEKHQQPVIIVVFVFVIIVLLN